MSLTQQQTDHIMKQSVERILDFIAKGLVKFPDDLVQYRNHPKFQAIEQQFGALPSPDALSRWNEISAMNGSVSPDTLAAALADFINKYGANKGNSNMISQAHLQLAALTEKAESAYWQSIDFNSIDSLLRHKHKFTASIHADEIEQRVWQLTDRSNKSQVNRYINEYPNGLHRSAAEEILQSADLWAGVSTDPDPVTLSDYIRETPSSPFLNEAYALLDEAKKQEIRKMTADPASYDLSLFNLMLKENIFTAAELIDNGVCTEQTLRYLAKPPMLPDIEQQVSLPAAPRRGATDVFFFGIPSSGKTCVLMGLLGAKDLYYDSAAGTGGSYADSLYIYRNHGKAPGRTYGNFVAQIQAVIRPRNANSVYPLNLIEMSGEEFAMKIAYNPSNEVNFENMGGGATKILSSHNPKIIFIVIDPTADGLITIATENADGSTQKKIVQQEIVINKIVNMLAKNPEVLKRTTAIHFIMTKADSLGPRSERQRIAVDRVNALYGPTIDNLCQICAKYGINRSSNFQPTLTSFSLGKFYIGDMFSYDSTDSDTIVSILRSIAMPVAYKDYLGNL